jgi:glycosyltransferase involved in cell wall biosynthesis
MHAPGKDMSQHALESQTLRKENPRLLVFVVAYNAERTLASVLDRIPRTPELGEMEVLVVDDASPDATFREGVDYKLSHPGLRIHVLKTPVNQGYGGNQKLGYRYAIDHGFTAVALVHGDGQYAPELLPQLVAPVMSGEADVVLGSRMLSPGGAKSGGMPLYKRIGNRILTFIQNKILGTAFSEFHTGYRIFRTDILEKIPFERNTNDFHFDTEIIIQLLLARARFRELPIPTHYGDEVCHVNGMRYARDVVKATVALRLHQMGLFYNRIYDLGQTVEGKYPLKLGYDSSHTFAINSARSGERVLDLGCGAGLVGESVRKKGCSVVGVDHPACRSAAESRGLAFVERDLNDGVEGIRVDEFDRVFLLDVVEHLREPESFLESLREAAGAKRPELILTTGNVAFFITRFSLLLGQFNYGQRGILDRTHTRLFTFRSLRAALEQSGYKILEVKGIPAPFPEGLGDTALARVLLRINTLLIRLMPRLFSYQIFVRAEIVPTVSHMLAVTIECSHRKNQEALQDLEGKE